MHALPLLVWAWWGACEGPATMPASTQSMAAIVVILASPLLRSILVQLLSIVLGVSPNRRSPLCDPAPHRAGGCLGSGGDIFMLAS